MIKKWGTYFVCSIMELTYFLGLDKIDVQL